MTVLVEKEESKLKEESRPLSGESELCRGGCAEYFNNDTMLPYFVTSKGAACFKQVEGRNQWKKMYGTVELEL